MLVQMKRAYDFLTRRSIQHVEDGPLLKHYGRIRDYTPDFPELEKQKRVNVFVYDHLMKGGTEHDMIAKHNILGRLPIYIGYTEDEFFHWKKDLGEESFSIALHDQITGHSIQKHTMKPMRIQGEVYSIRSPQIARLDYLRENGLQYFRKRVNIVVPHTKVIYNQEFPIPHIVSPPIQTIECWMYIGNGHYWDDQLGGVVPSSPVPVFDHVKPEIGYFSKYEFK